MPPGLRVAAGLGLVLAGATPARATGPDACLSSYESAQRLRLRSRLRAAQAALTTCVRPECPEVLRRDCSTWLAEVTEALPTVMISARHRGARVNEVRVLVDSEIVADRLDGTPIAVDPGKHLLRFELDGAPAVEQEVLILAGEKERVIEVSFAAPADAPRDEGPSTAPRYALGALGVVALGSFAYFGLSSHAKRENLAACKGHCPAEAVDEVRREQLVADVSLGVGLVALGVAAYLQLRRADGHSPPEGRWHLGVIAARRGASAALTARF